MAQVRVVKGESDIYKMLEIYMNVISIK